MQMRGYGPWGFAFALQMCKAFFKEIVHKKILGQFMDLNYLTLDASLGELFRGEYASTTGMPTNKDIFGNWTKCCMSGDYYAMNKQTHANKYAMPLRRSLMPLIRPRFLIPRT